MRKQKSQHTARALPFCITRLAVFATRRAIVIATYVMRRFPRAVFTASLAILHRTPCHFHCAVIVAPLLPKMLFFMQWKEKQCINDAAKLLRRDGAETKALRQRRAAKRKRHCKRRGNNGSVRVAATKERRKRRGDNGAVTTARRQQSGERQRRWREHNGAETMARGSSARAIANDAATTAP
jgi:hypothetical protein